MDSAIVMRDPEIMSGALCFAGTRVPVKYLFDYLEGHPTLHTDEGRSRLSPGMCAGFKAGTGNGHRLVNETSETVVYLEVGDRSPGDEGIYPDDDLKAVLLDGQWTFEHKDGGLY